MTAALKKADDYAVKVKQLAEIKNSIAGMETRLNYLKAIEVEEITSAIDESGKKLYPNETARQAELQKRLIHQGEGERSELCALWDDLNKMRVEEAELRAAIDGLRINIETLKSVMGLTASMIQAKAEK
jgi:hypothetical protein